MQPAIPTPLSLTTQPPSGFERGPGEHNHLPQRAVPYIDFADPIDSSTPIADNKNQERCNRLSCHTAVYSATFGLVAYHGLVTSAPSTYCAIHDSQNLPRSKCRRQLDENDRPYDENRIALWDDFNVNVGTTIRDATATRFCVRVKDYKATEVSVSFPSLERDSLAPNLIGLHGKNINLRSLDGESGVLNIQDSSVDRLGKSSAASNDTLLISASTRNRLRPTQHPLQRRPERERKHALDRFVRPRSNPSIQRESFILSTSTSSLTARERLLRRNMNDTDPFSPELIVLTLPQTQQQAITPQFRSGGVLNLRRDPRNASNRNLSVGAVWGIGGPGAATDIRPTSHERVSSHSATGSGAPRFRSAFLEMIKPIDERNHYEKRLALAFDFDLTSRVLGSADGPRYIIGPSVEQCCQNSSPKTLNLHKSTANIRWRDNVWARDDILSLLEAPYLRDDFYCSVLAYSPTIHRLAVGLANRLYLWTESDGVKHPPSELEVPPLRQHYITSLSFSSVEGRRAILAIARIDGRVDLWSPLDEEPRIFRLGCPSAPVNVSFRPTVLRYQSQRDWSFISEQEVLLVGDESGCISVYLVEWPQQPMRDLFGWNGAITLQCRLHAHTQQLCGMAWSVDGQFVASGGNDNLCCLFHLPTVLLSHSNSGGNRLEVREYSGVTVYFDLGIRLNRGETTTSDNARHRWRLRAAVKAISFCPWQRGLLAVGGGSNDRSIHFYHTFSGAELATIDCAAQITSLIWSQTRREIAATFGFAQPEHSIRVAVYAWPSCKQVAAIPWQDDSRALFAIPYPGGSSERRRVTGYGRSTRAVDDEYTIVVAASDGSVKFHDLWSNAQKATGPRRGLLGGSDILESFHGIDKEGEPVIR